MYAITIFFKLELKLIKIIMTRTKFKILNVLLFDNLFIKCQILLLHLFLKKLQTNKQTIVGTHCGYNNVNK